MKISKKLLKLLCERSASNREIPKIEGVIVFRSCGYQFYFQRVKGSESTWEFFIGEEDYQKGIGHHVTDLEECFGVIADDMYNEGRIFARQEFKDFLAGRDVDACKT